MKGDFADFPSEISVSQGSVRADFRPAEGIDAALLKLNYTWTLTDEDGAATTVPGDTLELTKADIGKTAQVTVEDTSGFYYGEITSSPFTVGRVATGVRIDGLSYDSDSNYFESNDALQALLTKDNAVIVTYLDPEGHKNIAYDKDEISLKYDSVDDGMLLDRAPTEPGTYSLNVAFTPNERPSGSGSSGHQRLLYLHPDDAHHHRDQGFSSQGQLRRVRYPEPGKRPEKGHHRQGQGR